MMNHPIELPTLEEIESIDQRRANAAKSLEIVDGLVKCQNPKCNSLKPLLTDNTRLICSNDRRVRHLRSMIKQIEKVHMDDGSRNSAAKEKQELADLLEDEKRRDIFRRLPLYNSVSTGYKYFCGECYNKAYSLSRRKAR